MSSPVSWDVAERVGVWVSSGRLKALGGQQLLVLDSKTSAAVEADFIRFTAQAEDLVVRATGLEPRSGPPRGVVVDRADWVRANIRSFRRLLAPLIDKLEQTQLPRPLSSVSGAVTGTQLGLVIGWMSTRVLGQYDILFTEDSISAAEEDKAGSGESGGDVVSYVGPNIVGLERRHGFAPEQFRLWIALHEVTHRCQFTGVPWLHEYFLSLVDEGLSGMTPDPGRFAESLRRAIDEIRAGRNPLEQSGLIGLVAGPEQLATIGKIQALMSLLEGHGDITMNRAGAELVPDAAKFAAVLHDRRKRAGPAARLMQQLIGMDAKLRQYEQGERFIEAVETIGGPELLARVWEAPDRLPSLEEIRDPSAWVARMNSLQLVAG
ncbi:MAG: zinc-dependent metalloprotease [Acidimicrobiales bacterium]